MSGEDDAGALIDARIAALDDWRGPVLARLRVLIHKADPGMVETVKWRKPSNPAGVPVWEHAGVVCTGELYGKGAAAYIKLNFARGASLADPAGVFNASLDGGTRRAIDIREGQPIDEAAFQALVQQAAALNMAKKTKAT